MSKDKNYQELQKLIKDVSKWVDEKLKPKSPERANEVRKNLMYLDITVRQDHSQAKAALYCAQAMWHMLFEDAYRGTHQRNLHKDKPPGEKASVEALKKAIDSYHSEHPKGKITHARIQVAKDYKYKDPKKEGAKYVATKTSRYNPYLK